MQRKGKESRHFASVIVVLGSESLPEFTLLKGNRKAHEYQPDRGNDPRDRGPGQQTSSDDCQERTGVSRMADARVDSAGFEDSASQ